LEVRRRRRTGKRRSHRPVHAPRLGVLGHIRQGDNRSRAEFGRARSSSPTSYQPTKISSVVALQRATCGMAPRSLRRRGSKAPTPSARVAGLSPPPTIPTATRGSSKRSRRGVLTKLERCPQPRDRRGERDRNVILVAQLLCILRTCSRLARANNLSVSGTLRRCSVVDANCAPARSARSSRTSDRRAGSEFRAR
jgi:hypothetical protein